MASALEEFPGGHGCCLHYWSKSSVHCYICISYISMAIGPYTLPTMTRYVDSQCPTDSCTYQCPSWSRGILSKKQQLSQRRVSVECQSPHSNVISYETSKNIQMSKAPLSAGVEIPYFLDQRPLSFSGRSPTVASSNLSMS